MPKQRREGRLYRQRYRVQTRDGGTRVKLSERWTLDYYDEDGNRVRERHGTDRQEAERALAKRVRAKRLPEAQRMGRATGKTRIQAVAEEYVAAMKLTLRPRTVERYEGALRSILEDLSALNVEDLTSPALRAYVADVTGPPRNVSSRTAEINVTTLVRALDWAVKQRMVPSNPVKEVGPIKGPKTRRRRALTDSEAERLLDASPPHYRRIWEFFLCTGLRRNELVQLRWGDVDLEARTIVVRDSVSKTHTEDWLPLQGQREQDAHRGLAAAASPSPGRPARSP